MLEQDKLAEKILANHTPPVISEDYAVRRGLCPACEPGKMYFVRCFGSADQWQEMACDSCDYTFDLLD